MLMLMSLLTPSMAVPTEGGVIARMPRPQDGATVYHPQRGPRRNHPRGF
jgi:hypothetical protein